MKMFFFASYPGLPRLRKIKETVSRIRYSEIDEKRPDRHKAIA